MADAVLDGIGIGKAIDDSQLTQAFQHNSEMKLQRDQMNEREGERKQQRSEMGYKRFQDSLGDVSALHTGAPTDPITVDLYSNILKKAQSLYAQGSDDMTVAMTLAPDVQKLHQYTTAAQDFAANKKQLLTNMAKEKGYDLEALDKGVTESAFYDTDKDGKKTLKSPDKINTDVASQAADYITSNPEKVSTDANLDDYLKKYPSSSKATDITTYDKKGGLNRFKGELGGPNYLVQDTGPNGETIQVPKYQEAVDQGQKLYHDFPQKDGTTVNAPVRLLDQDEYRKLMASPAATYMHGQIKQHIADYKDDDGKPLSLSSPKAEAVGRAIAYDEFNDRAAKTSKSTAVQDKPSAAQVKVEVNGDLQKQSHDKEMGKLIAQYQKEGTPYTRAYEKAKGVLDAGGSSYDDLYTKKKAEEDAKNASDAEAKKKGLDAADSTDRITRFNKVKDKTAALGIAKKFEGSTLSDGSKLTSIKETNALNLFNDYIVTTEKDGKTQEQKFTKSELGTYLKQQTKAEEAAPAAPATPGTKTPVTKAPATKLSAEELAKKYKF